MTQRYTPVTRQMLDLFQTLGGEQGPPGSQGPSGVGLNIKGSVVNEGDLPGGAAPGDVWVVTSFDPDHLFMWDGTGWVDLGEGGGSGGGFYVADTAAMRALTGLVAGQVVFVGDRMDQFVVVDDASLEADGGTVFIPNDQLSSYVEETIPWGWVLSSQGGRPTGVNAYYELAHSGLDFESVELVMTDDDHPTYPRETMTIWGLHGHRTSPGYVDRIDTPQLPYVNCGPGWFRDPGGHMTGDVGGGANWPHIRTGGVMLRYKYALSGLRLKRVIGGNVFHFDWWPVVAIDEEAPGEETDNAGKLAWCLNAAAKADAESVYVNKMFYYAGTIEIPDGVALQGRGIGLSGFKVTAGGAYREYLLSISEEPASLWKEYNNPIMLPVNHYWTWSKWSSGNYNPTFFPATGASRIKMVDIELDGNYANNLGVYSQRGPSAPFAEPVGAAGPYAYGYLQSGILNNVPSYNGFTCTSHGNRVVPRDGILELHNVKIHGYLGQTLLTSSGWQTTSTGILELGDTFPGHWMYTVDGEHENVRLFGFCGNDGIRTRKFIAKSVECKLYPPPPAIMNLVRYPAKSTGAGNENVPGTLASDYWGSLGPIRKIQIFSCLGVPAQSQYGGELGTYPWPQLMPHRIDIDYLFVDGSRLDEYDPSVSDYDLQIFSASADNIHIKSGKIRYGNKVQSVATPFVGGNVFAGGQPTVNNSFENLAIEYASRTSGIQLVTGQNFHQATWRNITIEPRAATPLLNTPGAGICILMTFAMNEVVPMEDPGAQYSHGGRVIDFSQPLLADSLNGPSKYIDITTADPAPGLFRVWFNYNSTGSAPAAGGRTLISAAVGATPTAQQLAAAFSAAIEANASAKALLTVATYNTISVIHSYLYWQSELIVPPVIDVANALDVAVTFLGGTATATTLAAIPGPHTVGDAYTVSTPQEAVGGHSHLWRWDGAAWVDVGQYPLRWRESRRCFEPSVLNFHHVIAQDPTYLFMMALSPAPGPHRDITFNFKECVFGALGSSYIAGPSNNGSFGTAANAEMKDRLHFNFEDTVLDMHDGLGPTNLDLLLYAGKFRGCRFRTPAVATGITSMGTGYEMLVSEQGGIYTVTPGVTDGTTTTTIDIQTKLFWVPKPGNIRVYPTDAATAAVWNGNMPYVEWRKSARPVSATSSALTPGAYSDPYYTVSDDRRAPVLRLTFATPLAAAQLKIGWSAAVSS